ncbi:MAG: DUF4386 domain-containing protein [Myxococcales bacterium]|nr:DUF4386 domain-containing protein [Myxococcales bacterium]
MSRNTTRIARLTGLAYLGIIATGIFAEVAVRMALVVDGDAAETTANIAASAGLFRLGILADVAMVGFDVAVAVGLLALLQHVHRPLAQLAAALRLIQAAVISGNLMNMAQAVQLATGGGSADALGAGAPGLVLSSMEVHALTYDLGLVFFGLSCLVLGWLLRRSGSVPALLAIGVSVAGVVYLVGSFAALCVPAWSAALDPAYGVAFLAELAFAAWLVAKGMAPRTTPSEAQVVASGA